MKRKEILRLIFVNPFEKIAGWQALGLGLIFVVLAAFIGSFRGAYFDGVLDLHFSYTSYPLWIVFAMLAVDFATLIILFLIAGAIFSKNFRVIDVIGTNFLAKGTALFLILTEFIPIPEVVSNVLRDPKLLMENPNVLFSSFAFILQMVLSVLIMIWYIALLYNAFSVSLNIKKGRRVVIFIVVLLLAEIVSKIVIHFLF
jgi:hypothetical protein